MNQATHPTTLLLPAFGALIPGQGGYFAAVLRGLVVDGVEQAPDALIVSDAALGEIAAAAWGNYGKDVPGTTSRTDGRANTAAMAAAGSPAALQLQAITIDGHSDYFLPSLGELNSAAANVPELFAKEWYWTSTQGGRHGAFAQAFGSGYSYWGGKDGELRCRAFRRVPLHTLSA
jgi:hypothetical protein